MEISEIRKKYQTDRFFEEVFDRKIYAPTRELGELDIVIDLGACAGEFSLYIQDLAKKVYALEPNAGEYVELTENIKDYPKIKAFNIALSDYNGEGFLVDGVRGGHQLAIEPAQRGNFVVTKTLAQFMKENSIEQVDVLKIDIEDSEIRVFSAPDFAEVAPKIKFVIGEHGGNDLLKPYGFTITSYEYGWIAKRND